MATLVESIEQKFVTKLTNFCGFEDEKEFFAKVKEIKTPVFRLKNSQISQNSREKVMKAWESFKKKDEQRKKKFKPPRNIKNIKLSQNVKNIQLSQNVKNIKLSQNIKNINLSKNSTKSSNSSCGMEDIEKYRFEVCFFVIFFGFFLVG